MEMTQKLLKLKFIYFKKLVVISINQSFIGLTIVDQKKKKKNYQEVQPNRHLCSAPRCSVICEVSSECG